jgi:3-hexulose-6-phosphate synthase/6-phospho-3-hexuloisomerase
MNPIVQISLDVTTISEALETAERAARAGVDWLEVGTPLVIAEGMHGVRALRERFPEMPIIVDLKTMDGGWLEVKIMADAGATHVVVMGQAHRETVELVVQAGRDFGVQVMGDNLGMSDPVQGARELEEAGCDIVIHHVGFDFRTVRRERGETVESPLVRLREIVNTVSVPVQAVGGLSLEEAVEVPRFGAPIVVIGAPLAIDAHSFQAAAGDVEGVLREICERVHAYGDIPVN